jgi:hypothetical protein
VPAVLAAADGLILEELDRTIAYRTRNFIYCPGLPIAAVLAWTSHEIPPLSVTFWAFLFYYAGILWIHL